MVPEARFGIATHFQPISFSPHRFQAFPNCCPNFCRSCYLGEYVGWRIEANRDCHEAVDYYDDYDEHYVH